MIQIVPLNLTELSYKITELIVLHLNYYTAAIRMYYTWTITLLLVCMIHKGSQLVAVGGRIHKRSQLVAVGDMIHKRRQLVAVGGQLGTCTNKYLTYHVQSNWATLTVFNPFLFTVRVLDVTGCVNLSI